MRKVSLGLVLAVCLSSFGELTYSAELPASEGLALGAIAAKLKISPDLWNFGLEPCYGWPKVVGNKTVDVTNELNCTCNETTKACHVQSIRLKSTNLVGELPDEELANLTHLATLDLTRNYIDGSIPTTWAKLPLKQISIIGNRLSGEIPEEIGDISTLESFVLENNLLGGQIPASLGNLVNLKRPLLSANNFVGELPDSLGKLTNLTDFRIDGTGISGKFPSFIGNWTLLKRLDMQGTSLEGPFPSTLSKLTKLEELRVSDFKGDGDFPQLEKMSSLKSLILRNCTISGRIPEFLGNLRKLKVLSQGKMVLKDFNIAKAAEGTGREIVMPFIASIRNTLEIDFRWSGKGTNAFRERGNYGPLISAISVTPNFKPQVDFGDGLRAGSIVSIIIGCLLVISLIVVISWILLCKKERENEELKQLKLQGTYFNLRQIKAATKNFDPGNKIGEGGFGPVYKGVLPDGSIVAVKQLSSKSKQGNCEFVNEIAMISALQHRNLIKLFGYCIEGRQLLLIYEYLENNSLSRALFGREEARLKLDWQRRRKISLDIARGLAYLHEESRLKIVHRDIKATNILLDKNLNAKISDFGLAKLDDEENTHISTQVAGTIGYMAPEYARCGCLTEKADVYSYGVVLLEVISGKSNTNYRSEDFVCLLDWANFLLRRGKLLELVDPFLGSNYSKTEAEQMLNLALVCANSSYTCRPTMTSVISMMEERTPVNALMELSLIAETQNEFQCFEGHTLDSILCFEEHALGSNGICPDGRSFNVEQERRHHLMFHDFTHMI